MTTLKGSEKQVNWANDIRDEKLAALRQLIADTNALETTDGPMIAATMEWLEARDSAAFWIDYRDTQPVIILKQAARLAGVM